MRYFDTSFLVPIFIGEQFSARVEKFWLNSLSARWQ